MAFYKKPCLLFSIATSCEPCNLALEGLPVLNAISNDQGAKIETTLESANGTKGGECQRVPGHYKP